LARDYVHGIIDTPGFQWAIPPLLHGCDRGAAAPGAHAGGEPNSTRSEP
jgi:hypothetical protein